VVDNELKDENFIGKFAIVRWIRIKI
jgi:hypothetical protein